MKCLISKNYSTYFKLYITNINQNIKMVIKYSQSSGNIIETPTAREAKLFGPGKLVKYT